MAFLLISLNPGTSVDPRTLILGPKMAKIRIFGKKIIISLGKLIFFLGTCYNRVSTFDTLSNFMSYTYNKTNTLVEQEYQRCG